MQHCSMHNYLAKKQTLHQPRDNVIGCPQKQLPDDLKNPGLRKRPN